MKSLLRPFIPLLLLGPALALFSERANAATPVATAPTVPAAVAKVERTPVLVHIGKARIYTVAIQSCARSGNRMIC